MFARRPGLFLTFAGIFGAGCLAFYRDRLGKVSFPFPEPFIYSVLIIMVIVLAYFLNMVLVFMFGGKEVSERTKDRWKEVVRARLEGSRPYFKYEDTLDRAAQVKMIFQKILFRWRD